MRQFLPVLLLALFLATLSGCTIVHHTDPETGLEVNHVGGAYGAVKLIHATDPRPYGLAESAMDEGMSTSLARDADGDVRFNANPPYTGYPYTGQVGIYGGGNTVYVPGVGLMPTAPPASLPALATRDLPSTAPQGYGVAPCPEGREPRTTEEVAACALKRARDAEVLIRDLHP